MKSPCFVSYLRVSTAKQGASGLGLEAQRAAVAGFMRGQEGATLLGEFVEVESGRKSERPELAKALAQCRVMRAELIVANVSRLTRSVGFLSRLLEAGVEVRFCDLPQIEGPTGRFMLQQMAAVAELEAGMIGERTRKALAAAKARGTKLGNPNGAAHLKELGSYREAVKAIRERADARAHDLKEILVELEAGGITSARAVAKALNDRGVPTPRAHSKTGAKWGAQSVLNLRARLGSNV